MKFILTISVLTLLLLSSCKDGEKICHLSGIIKERNDSSILLIKATEFARYSGVRIPVDNGRFEYTFHYDDTEAYHLVFVKELEEDNLEFYTTFFSCRGKVKLIIYPYEKWHLNKLTGGDINNTFFGLNCQFQNQKRVLLNPIDEALQHLDEAGFNYSHEADSLKCLSDSIWEIISSWQTDYKGLDYSLIAYYYFIRELKGSVRTQLLGREFRETFKEFEYRYPEHPYTSIAKDIINSSEQIVVGGKFIDFSLPDLTGSMHNLSDLIAEKFAVINLWATWCGPCIKHTRELVPIFEEYKNNNFTVVSIAEEFNNTIHLEAFLEKENPPWINLVDLDAKNKIWDKYGVPNSGGEIFLVDNKGIILAINPSVEDIRSLLHRSE